MPAGEDVWYRDLRGFMTGDNFLEVLPAAGASLAEKLNACVRAALYYAAIMLVARRNPDVLVVPVIAACATYVAYEHAESRGEAFGTALGGAAGECREPTPENPFMNLPPVEFGSGAAGACDPLDSRVREAVEDAYARGGFADADDVFRRNTGERAFYTTPVTTDVNDQRGFAEWLYGGVNCAGKQVRPPPPPAPDVSARGLA